MTTPTWLCLPDDLGPAAAGYWKYYARGLYRADKLHPEQVEQFKNLCRLLAISAAASAEIEKNGVTLGAQRGGKRPNPACDVLLSSERRVATLLKEFGLA